MKVKPEDTIAYVYTSGTTGGTPKAAVIKHGRLVRCMYFNGKIVLNLKPQDTMYVPLPFFHTNALALSWPTVFANGSAVAIRRKFSVSNFWSDVRKYNATAWCYIGELCRYLMNQPPRPDDCDNPLTKIIGNGLRSDIWHDFKKRFGISKVYEILRKWEYLEFGSRNAASGPWGPQEPAPRKEVGKRMKGSGVVLRLKGRGMDRAI